MDDERSDVLLDCPELAMSEKKTLVGKSVSWVRFDNFGSVKCVRCGTEFKIEFPWILRRVVRMALFFEREHSHCQKKNP